MSGHFNQDTRNRTILHFVQKLRGKVQKDTTTQQNYEEQLIEAPTDEPNGTQSFQQKHFRKGTSRKTHVNSDCQVRVNIFRKMLEAGTFH